MEYVPWIISCASIFGTAIIFIQTRRAILRARVHRLEARRAGAYAARLETECDGLRNQARKTAMDAVGVVTANDLLWQEREKYRLLYEAEAARRRKKKLPPAPDVHKVAADLRREMGR